jgi:hypothetical protein
VQLLYIAAEWYYYVPYYCVVLFCDLAVCATACWRIAESATLLLYAVMFCLCAALLPEDAFCSEVLKSVVCCCVLLSCAAPWFGVAVWVCFVVMRCVAAV